MVKEGENILHELRKTSKGQLTYNRSPKFEVNSVSTYQLPYFHQEQPRSLKTHVSPGLWCPDEESPKLKDESFVDEEKEEQENEDADEISKKLFVNGKAEIKKFALNGETDKANARYEETKEEEHTDGKTSPAEGTPEKKVMSPISPRECEDYSGSQLAVKKYEDLLAQQVQQARLAKQREFDENTAQLTEQCHIQLRKLEEAKLKEVWRQCEKREEQLRKSDLENVKRRQQLKEIHKLHRQNLDAKIQEWERRKQQLEREEREKKLKLVQEQHKKIFELQEQFTQMYNNCQFKDHLSEAAKKSVQLMTQIFTNANTVLAACTPTSDLDVSLKKLSAYAEHAQNALDFIRHQTDEATKKGKEEAEKQQQQQQQQQKQQQPQDTQTVSTTASSTGVSSSQPSISGGKEELTVVQQTLKIYAQSTLKQQEVKKTLEGFVNNPQMKKYKFDLSKAVNTPINAISPISGDHLRDKLQRLLNLIEGQQVEVSGKVTSTRDAPEAALFCKNLVARMIVKKGEEQVSSKHDSAFALAAVAVGLWYKHSDIGELLLTQFHEFCPYIVPYYLPHQEGQPMVDYHKALGYKIEDGSIETQDKFLKRMSGIMRLYAAIMVSPLPPGPGCPHPHGVEFAWQWLARTLNMEPQPDITATMMYDLLQVTGHSLIMTYRTQFVKLLFAVIKEFLPKAKKVAASGGPVVRLENFLETTMKKSCQIPKPDGMLASDFWLS